MNNPAKIADSFIWFLEFLSQKPYWQPYMYPKYACMDLDTFDSSCVYISKKDTPPQELRRSDVWCLCNLIRTTSTYKGVCRSLSDDDGWRGQRVPAEQVLRVLEFQQR